MWTSIRVAFARIRALFRSDEDDREFRLELDTHLSMLEEENVRRGMKPDRARRAARVELGGLTQLREDHRETRGLPLADAFRQDLRFSARLLAGSPAFSLAVVLTFALGVGANTAAFSVLHSVLLKPLPYPASERLVWFGEAAGSAQGISVTPGNFQHWREGNRTFEEMSAFQFTEQTLTGRSEPLVMRGLAATYPYFDLLGMDPLLGRFFQSADDRPGAGRTIVLNYGFWSKRLGGDAAIVGSALTLDGSAYEVIGVAAPLWEPWQVDYYLPLGTTFNAGLERSRHGSIRMIGRLMPGVTLPAARADLDGIMVRLANADPGPESEHRSFGRYLAENTTGGVRGTLLVLMGAASLILLIACANISGLMLARNTARGSEMAVRQAIGAGRLRLVRQLLTETVIIGLAGGVAGVALAYWALRSLTAMAPEGIPRLSETSIDLTVLAFGGGVTLFASLLAGLASVALAGRVDLASALKAGGRTSSASRPSQSFRNGLVVAQVALTFVLAFGSGQLLRSLLAAQASDPGFDDEGVLSFSLQLPSSRYETAGAATEFYRRLLAELRALPGVVDVGAVHCPPGTGSCGDWFYSVPERTAPAPNEVPIALFNSAAPGYFKVMGIPLREGREFDETDRVAGAAVAVVNETFARAWWPDETAVGHQIKVGGPYQQGPLVDIVGVAGNVRQRGLDSTPLPEIYQPFLQSGDRGMTIVVRAANDPEALTVPVRSRIAKLDGELPLKNLEKLENALHAGLARRRFSALLLTLFAGLAMALAAVGIYGLLSHWVRSRESEIAIRLALGARAGVILWWAGARVLRLCVAGGLFGALGAWATARWFEELVFGIPPRNPETMMVAALAVGLLGFAAAALPAWRASRVDAARRLNGP